MAMLSLVSPLGIRKHSTLYGELVKVLSHEVVTMDGAILEVRYTIAVCGLSGIVLLTLVFD